MSQPESILNELRAAKIRASDELRARVREIAAQPAEPASEPFRLSRPRLSLPSRRTALVLAPAAIALSLSAALAVGLATTGGKEKAAVSAKASAETERDLALPAEAKSAAGAPTGGSPAGLPATPGRAQLYEAQLTLKVKELSAVTKQALRLTRSYGGYVRRVDYGSGSERGSASLVVRVPVGRVQDVLVRFSSLGVILDQHISIKDVQPRLDARQRAMQRLRAAIAKLEGRLADSGLAADEREALETQLAASRRRLDALERWQAQQRRQTSFATVSLALRTAGASALPPPPPNRIERALDRSASILLDELKVLVYVGVVGAPLLLAALLGIGTVRARWRRIEARLLG